MNGMNRAKQLRLDSGTGLEATAEKAGISFRTLRKIEAGRDVQAASLVRLASVYGVRPSDLMGPAVFSTQEGEAA